MTKRSTTLLVALLLALVGTVFVPAFRATAKQAMDMMHMMMQAKTPADHEKLAAHYDKEAAAARAKAAMHKSMAEEIRKTGGYLVEKVHYDQHCDSLVALFTKAAEEYEALAKGERDMAKQAK